MRTTPHSLARKAAGNRSTQRAAEALLASGLHAVAKTPLAQLSPSQTAAAHLLAPLVSNAELCLIDGVLDRLDPKVRTDVLCLLEAQCSTGRAMIITTHHTNVARACSRLLILKPGRPPFQGTIDQLLIRNTTQELIVETEDPSTVGALASPFAIDVRQIDGGVALRPREGQDLAAKLLTEGYGSVRAVVTPFPDLETAIREELGR